MKKRNDLNVMLVIGLAIIVIIASLVMWADDTYGAGITSSWDGTEDLVTFSTDTQCDSVVSVFKFVSSGTARDTIKLSPTAYDSTSLYGAGLRLDSLGLYYCISTAYHTGGGTGIDTTLWYHNPFDAIPELIAPVAGKTCAVTVVVRDNQGNPAAGVWVAASLTRSNVTDSNGYAILNTTFRDKTDQYGMATINCLWSSYLVPNTDWLFTVQTPSLSGLRKVITVPRDTTYVVDLR